jgi:hypothetical protein
MKQTAVEFLMGKLFDQSTMVTEQMQWFEQAKAMEKEQLKNVWLDGRNSRTNGQDPMEQIKNL